MFYIHIPSSRKASQAQQPAGEKAFLQGKGSSIGGGAARAACTPFPLPLLGLSPKIAECAREEWGSSPAGGGLWFSRGSGRWEMGDPGVRVRLGGLFWLLPSSLGVSVGSSPWPLGALRQLGFQLVLLPFGPNPVARAGTAGALLGFPRIPLQISILAVPSPPPGCPLLRDPWGP